MRLNENKHTVTGLSKLKPQRKPRKKTLLSCASGAGIKVWVNLKSGVYHCPNTRYYGNTKKGEMMPQDMAVKSGYHGAHNMQCD